MKSSFAAALAVACIAASSASAASVTFTKLTGVAGASGGAATAVFKADLSSAGLAAINSVTITDSGVIGGSAPGQFSGFDLDAVFISNVDCATAACAAALVPIAALDYVGSLFAPGSQLAPTDPKLFGTTATGLAVDNVVATLGSFDAFSSTATPAGFVSLGVNGSLALNLLSQLIVSGPLFLYIGEVGDNGELAAGGIVVSQNPVPLPAALPMFLAGLAGMGVAKRRKQTAR